MLKKLFIFCVFRSFLVHTKIKVHQPTNHSHGCIISSWKDNRSKRIHREEMQFAAKQNEVNNPIRTPQMPQHRATQLKWTLKPFSEYTQLKRPNDKSRMRAKFQPQSQHSQIHTKRWYIPFESFSHTNTPRMIEWKNKNRAIVSTHTCKCWEHLLVLTKIKPALYTESRIVLCARFETTTKIIKTTNEIKQRLNAHSEYSKWEWNKTQTNETKQDETNRTKK